MTSPIQYEQYRGGEHKSAEPAIDGMSFTALNALAATLRHQHDIRSSDEGDRLVLTNKNVDDDNPIALTARQLAYILGQPAAPELQPKTPEQHRSDTLAAFQAVAAQYPADAFAALCPRVAALEEPQSHWSLWPKPRPKPAPDLPNKIRTVIEVSGITYEVATYYVPGSSMVERVDVRYDQAHISLVYGGDGGISSVEAFNVIPTRSGTNEPYYNQFNAVRAARTGKRADIPATTAILNHDIARKRSGDIRIAIGYEPSLSFRQHAPNKYSAILIATTYDAASNTFVLEYRKKHHTIPAETAVQMLDELLSILPIDPLRENGLPNAHDLR